MDDTSDSAGDPRASVGGFAYGIGLTFGVLILVSIVTVTYYFCTRNYNSFRGRTFDRSTSTFTDGDDSVHTLELGLDEETLRSYPKFAFSQAKGHGAEKDQPSCSICLGEYKDRDVLRLLPDCGHFFHLSCVDPWLMLHPSCPICRKSPLQTPLPTPLAEVAPLSARRM